MGEGPVSWAEITEWQRNTGIELDAWEARTIRRLSQVFVSQRHDAEKADCPAPFHGGRSAMISRRESVAQKIAAAFGLKMKR